MRKASVWRCVLVLARASPLVRDAGDASAILGALRSTGSAMVETLPRGVKTGQVSLKNGTSGRREMDALE
jgi:hypothetical protein